MWCLCGDAGGMGVIFWAVVSEVVVVAFCNWIAQAAWEQADSKPRRGTGNRDEEGYGTEHTV